MENTITIPISVGELFDKISILDIKLKYITDHRKDDVYNEFNILSSKVQDLLIKYKYYYDLIKQINEDLWHFMDKIRTLNMNDNQNDWIYFCKKSIDYNDIRFRIKSKINKISNSSLMEQKSYKLTKYTINYQDESNLNKLIILIKYNSLIYDVVEINCNIEIFKSLKEQINDPYVILNTIHQYTDNIINYTLYNNTKLNNTELFSFIEKNHCEFTD